MSSFKIGEVVTTVYGEKAIVVEKDNVDYKVLSLDEKRAYWREVYELSKTKDKPFKVLKADRKDSEGWSDYTFYLVYRGRKMFLSAGCRFFTNLSAARKHWKKDINWDTDYPEGRKFLNKASLKIINRFEKKMKG